MKKNIMSWLAGLMLVAPAVNGCTTYAPRFDSQGNYLGEQRVDDPGRTIAALGRLNGGLFGLALEAAGNHESREQQMRQNEQFRLNMQRQINQRGLGTNQISPREQFLKDFSDHKSTAFICNDVEDSNNNGVIEGYEFVGDLTGVFAANAGITMGYIHWGNSGRRIMLQLRSPSGNVEEQTFEVQGSHRIERFSFPPEQRELGNYTLAVYIDGDYNTHGQFIIKQGIPENNCSELKSFGDGNE
ncbi:MAG: hypothetical protein ABII03_01485 [Nanoarchaeota archaeon]|nr:hypothetical protein [Nanoarchaeota archaeon]